MNWHGGKIQIFLTHLLDGPPGGEVLEGVGGGLEHRHVTGSLSAHDMDSCANKHILSISRRLNNEQQPTTRPEEKTGNHRNGTHSEIKSPAQCKRRRIYHYPFHLFIHPSIQRDSNEMDKKFPCKSTNGVYA